MNSFTTLVPLDGDRWLLPMQLLGVRRDDLGSALIGEQVQSITISASSSLEMTWFARIMFASGRCMELTGSSTEVGGWVEYGTLNIEVDQSPEKLEGASAVYPFDPQTISSLQVLTVETGVYLVEAGIVIGLDDGSEFIAIAGEIPGAFSLVLPDGKGRLDPQFPWSEYRRYD